MSDQIKSNRELVLDIVRKMDEVCAGHDYSWSDALVHWLFYAVDCDPQNHLSKSSYYKDILLQHFFTCGDFDTTLGIIVEAFLAGDVHQLAADNEKLLEEIARLRARVAELEGERKAFKEGNKYEAKP